MTESSFSVRLRCRLNYVIMWVNHGLVSFQILQKYDPQKEEELKIWIEEVTGKRLGENFQISLKDGVILCM